MTQRKPKDLLQYGAYLTLLVVFVGLVMTIFKWGVGWSDLHAQVKLKANLTQVTALKYEIREIKMAFCHVNKTSCKYFTKIPKQP